MKTFIQHSFPTLPRVTVDGQRYYKTPDDKLYRSVTTIVSHHTQHHIQKWKETVGEQQAAIISNRASKRGTAIHTLCEQFLKNQQPIPSDFDKEIFDAMVPELNKIDNIHALETAMYSDTLQAAGTTDLIAEYNNTLSVIDFKTSAKPKTIDKISHYFIQTAAYAFMFWDHTKLLPKQLVIIIGTDNNPTSVFIQPVKYWLTEFVKLNSSLPAPPPYPSN